MGNQYFTAQKARDLVKLYGDQVYLITKRIKKEASQGETFVDLMSDNDLFFEPNSEIHKKLESLGFKIEFAENESDFCAWYTPKYAGLTITW